MRRPATNNVARTIRDRVPRGVNPRGETKRFEALVAELSEAMALAPSHSVDLAVGTWLGKICLTLGLDRAAIYERDAPGKPVRVSHTWVRANFPPLPKNYDPEKLFKRTTDWVMAGNQYLFSCPSEIPDEWGDVKRFVARYGPTASATLPMWAGGRTIGAATFGKFGSPRAWPPELIERLALAVRLVGSAIERKQSEASLQQVRAELRLASRRSMMGELVGSLAHELNQPLGAILSTLGGLARLLSKGNPEPAMALTAVSDAIEDTKRAGEIVRRVRTMFKGDETRKRAIGISALVAEVVRLIESEAAVREIAVRTEVSPSAQRVFGDRVQLQQCVLNLLMNAFEAIAEARSDRREVTVKVAPEKTGWISLSVSDTGAGIDPSVAHRLFEPFVTTKSKGMGLGLLVTRSIVENHGGKIWVMPNPDWGTTFTFALPLAKSRREDGMERRTSRK
jgi:signal transduction histidine kinase